MWTHKLEGSLEPVLSKPAGREKKKRSLEGNGQIQKRWEGKAGETTEVR